ncbi:MAG: Putrescine transport system permease protein PotH [Paracidovorax wautersii]|uniref:Putrescine transport system permease protein PotH n=1 Tax=Paracidovorax wautersii TaxID=1177982 RepID=A0A7V8FNN2_9BURK|nr:MAG: Putrescine transport system permease protein PotH [Paracidovorax wautersii]
MTRPAPSHEPWQLDGRNLVAPATLFVVLGLLAPMALLLRYSVNLFVPGQFMVEGLTLDNYLRFFTDPFYLNVLGRTVRVAVVCTLVCLVVAFPLAYVLARTQSRFKNLLVIAIVLPLFVGNSVRAAGWMVAFGNKGALNSLLLGAGLINAPLEIMYTELAVVVGIIAVNLPFMVLSLQGVIEGIGRHLEEAAFNLGAPPAAMFRHVLWPLAVPGISAGVILTFILAMNAYATPVLLGGPRFQMMGPLVFDQFIQQNNWPFGGAIAFILMTVTLLLSAVANLLVQRRRA